MGIMVARKFKAINSFGIMKKNYKGLFKIFTNII
jgi:hypothetical protein